MAHPSRKMGNISLCFLFILFFSVTVKVLPVTPLLSGVCAQKTGFLHTEEVFYTRNVCDF